MAHNLDFSNNQANVAYAGSRNDVWHKLGQERMEGQPFAAWLKAAGLNWNAVKVPCLAELPDGSHKRVEDRSVIVRDDTFAPLGICSGESETEGYKIVQPRECAEFMDHFVKCDPRFKLDTMGSLNGGARIWASASFSEDITIASEKHRVRLMGTTSFDSTAASVFQGTIIRPVCNNTVTAALADTRAVIRVRHSTKLVQERVREQLAQVLQGVDTYRNMGDAMVKVNVSTRTISDYFKAVLEIPFDAKKDDISTRKLNVFRDLERCYQQTVREGTEHGTAWAAWNAVTRYVDHDRSARGVATYGDEQTARFASAQFGSGNALKGRALNLMTAYMQHPEKELALVTV